MRLKDLESLEYFKFLQLLSEFTGNKLTKEKILNTKPEKDEKILLQNIQKTEEFINIVNKEGYFPLTEYPDITESLKLLSIEDSILSVQDIIEIGNILFISRQIKNFLSNVEKKYLLDLYKKIGSSREVEKIINDTVDKSTNSLKDNASTDLSRIRKQIKDTEKNIISILEKILHSRQFEDIIQDKIITIRRDRFVIPVKTNFSSKIKGIIQDKSSSGQTLYIEPINIIELNNNLSNLKIEESIEIRRILKFITDLLREKYDMIKSSFEAIIELDYLYTKVKFAKKVNAVFPKISDKINLIQAKHPTFLLKEKNFNPIDLIATEKRAVIITGSNTGGKTVALKTLGLNALLLQSAIPIPVAEESEITIFDGIYADIGDMQSIEQDLSTYSSHIINIKEILSLITDKSLLLLDELIPGTDPDEASAIGIGILHKIKEKKSFAFITTHFKKIKMFALSDDYFEVASVGFDLETLKPTYKLYYKSVGQSMAFSIAKRLGLDEEILKIAENYVENIDLNKMIEALENYRKLYEEQYYQYLKLREEVEKEKEKYKKLNEELERKKKEKWKEELKEAEEFIKNLRKEGYRIIDSLKEKELSAKDLEKFIKIKKEQLKTAYQEDKNIQIEELKEGDKVKIKGKSQIGEIITIREDKANVNFGGIKIWINLDNLEKVEKEEKTKLDFKIKKEIKPIPTQINLIGKTKEEAIKELSEYIDKAVLQGISTFRIIHGYGSGILRKAVREYLDNLPFKVRYEDAPYQEGGLGVTIVYIE